MVGTVAFILRTPDVMSKQAGVGNGKRRRVRLQPVLRRLSAGDFSSSVDRALTSAQCLP
jgi:hypothetical protein